jgi:predicted nucleic acid-binding protein
MAAEGKVVDASAVAALLFGEPPAAEVASRLGGAVLIAPTLLRYEIANVCLKKLALYPTRRRVLLRALSLLDETDLREMAVPADEVVTLARRKNLTAYDASYLWLARTLGLELVTLDHKLARIAK